MGNKLLLVLGVVIVVLGLLVKGAAYTVNEAEQVLVMRFGKVVATHTDPGIKFKAPMLDDLIYYEKRVLNIDPPAENLLLADQKRVLVDAFARYRIADPQLFFQRLRQEETARQRLGVIISSTLRAVLGKTTLATLLSEERTGLLAEILAGVQKQAVTLGIVVLDVRIRRADLPDEVRDRVYDRMSAERERIATEFRAQGFELAQRIKAAADREATVIAAEAKREAEILRGQGEGRRTTILNDAYGQDPEFFNFYRSMQAYSASLGGDNTFMVLSPDSEFFSFFGEADGQPALGAPEE